jgi:hypothetical protein
VTSNADAARNATVNADRTAADEPAPKPRRGDGGECQRCHKALMWPSADGLGPVCRRIEAAERAAAEQNGDDQ